MAYWITLRKGGSRNGFQVETAQEALDVLLSSQSEYDFVRVVHPDGNVMTAVSLAIEAENEVRIRARRKLFV